MEKHYNLYYLFLEDKMRHLLSAEQKEKNLEFFQEFFKNIKPP